MVDPVSAGLAIGGKLVQGIGAYSAGRANAKALKTQARGELISGAAEEARVRDAARAQIGEQVASQFANGLEGGSGSALDAVRESLINARLDALEVRRQARIRSDELLSRAKLEKRQGQFALASSILGAGSSAMSMQSDWADARRGLSGGASYRDPRGYGGARDPSVSY